ncbi:MAG: response regulator transcription factor [Flavobacteriales bacterium]|nr:response regulator transcription factor [Flavobacteriales bacterium]
MTPAIARLVVASLQGGASSTMQQALLTTKEREVLDGLAAGLMYKEIADKLAVNISTIRTHVRSIYEKLQVHSRAEAVRRAFPAKR